MSSQGLDDQPNSVHFFKVILENNLQEGKLRVPKSFVRRHWKGIANPVLLRLPNKTEKKISWEKSDNDIWFCDGWKEFANYLSLKASQFVVFRYEENSCFNVIVFRESGLEIKYPPRETAEECEEADDESECSLKILEDLSSSPSNKRRKSPSPSSQTCKKMRTNSNERKEFYRSNVETKYVKSGSSKDPKERIKAFHEKVKKEFHSEKDFFICAIQKSYTTRDLLMIPNEFSNPHLHKMEEKIATLFDQHRTWDVKLMRNSVGQMTFTKGWRKFLNYNNLKVGDVCAFVLNDSKGLTFEVFTFPIEKYSSTPLHQEQEELFNKPSSSIRTPESPKSESRMISEKEFIHYIRRPSSNSSSIRTPESLKSESRMMSEKEFIHYIRRPSSNIASIPINYIRNFVSETGKIATLRVGERSWPVKVLFYDRISCARFFNGWTEFAGACELKVGDSCHFKIVDEEKLEFEVTISRHSR